MAKVAPGRVPAIPPRGRRMPATPGGLLLAASLAIAAGAGGGTAWAGTVVVPSGAADLELDRHAVYFLDGSGALGIEEVVSAGERFRPLGGRRSFGYTRAAIWLRADLANPSAEARDLLLVYEFPLVERIDVWVDRRGGREHHRGGLAVPIPRRDIVLRGDGHRLPLRLDPGERVTAWLRADMRDTAFVGLSALDPGSLASRDVAAHLWEGLNLGILALVLLVAARAAASRPRGDRPAIFHLTLLVVGLSAYRLSATGPLAALAWPASPRLASAFPTAAAALGAAAGLRLTALFLHLRERRPRWEAATSALALASLATAAALPFDVRTGGTALALMGLADFTAVAAVAVEALVARDPAARAFAFAWSPFLAMGLAYMSAVLGWLPARPLVIQAFGVSFTAAILLISRAFSSRSERADQDDRTRLEHLVQERTLALETSLGDLRAEVEQRRRAVEALRESEERFRAAFQTMPHAIAINRLDDGLYVEVNDGFGALFGWPEHEVLGKTTAEIPVFAEPGEHLRFLATLRARGRVENLEAAFAARDGRRLQARLWARVLQVRGEPLVLTAIADVTAQRHAEAERTRLEREVRQAQKMEALGRLAGGVAHDFNNVLTAIIATAGLAILEAPAGDPNRPLLQDIREAARRGADLTRQLLAVSRNQVLAPRPVDLNGLVSNLRRMLERLLREDVELRLDLAPGLPPVLADTGQLEQVVMNLTVNARDALEHGGAITISTRRAEVRGEDARPPERAAGRYAVVTVADSGRGIPPKALPHLFEPFFTSKPVGQGTGLGLSTVYGIVRQHGGFVDVDSAPGRGTSFRVHLPLAEEEPGAAEEQRRAEPLPRGSETVLLVEDEAGVREVARNVLARLGYQVLVAPDGDEALALAARHQGPLHLLVTDMVLPSLSGREVAESLRARLPECRVLYMSGHPEVLAAGLGGPDFLPKPFSPEALARKVRQVLG